MTPNMMQSALSAEYLTSEEISAYFLNLERLLERIEHSTTHYLVLGLERTASFDQIVHSYREIISLLYPTYSISESMPTVMLARIEAAFKKTSGAFAMLAGFARRKDYDNRLFQSPGRAAAPAAPQKLGDISPVKRTDQRPAQAAESLPVAQNNALRSSYSEFAGSRTNDNRRRTERYDLALPVRVVGYERKDCKWDEMSKTVNVSRTGLQLRLRRRVGYGTVLFLTLPFPVKLRSHGFTEPSYNVYGLVRRIGPPKNGMRLIGLEFIGEHPPAGYLEKPWAAFRTNKWAGGERRRARRYERSEFIQLEYITEDMHVLAIEQTITENISRTGLRIIVKAAPPQFDFIRVTCPGYNFEGLAIFCNRFIGRDGRERLSLRFLDKEWPL